ncbi:MAG: acetyl-CoA carboxylase biotin carboxylase subunit [Ideonella sp.]|nr:acetyl-CoA carboxylase biotin carboxylase subunit [Ideonella sp.]
MPFSRVLVANRGEIAVRIIRTCREMDLETVAVFSEADHDSSHVRLAGRSVCIGPAPAARSYLLPQVLVGVAKATGADAIHPGYGLLAENAEFAALCAEQGLVWIGPDARVIASMGDKAEARRIAIEADVPVIPGSSGTFATAAQARLAAAGIGYPVLLKAAAGGGGRGMRLVANDAALVPSFEEASSEAQAAFRDGRLYLEKYLRDVRHIEVQILADAHGAVLHLGERDCSLQRRHQKLVEESPAPIDPLERNLITEAAVRIARHTGYQGAGTVEFVFDRTTRAVYFIEVNCRIQVEHPVTECVTGIDIVREQLRIAQGEALELSQGDVQARGHAIELRINAEDPARNFLPMPGVLKEFTPPGGPGVRIDTHCRPGYAIPPYYDSLIAKLIVHAPDRNQALARGRRALAEFEVGGVPTTIPFLARVLAHTDFIDNRVHTRWVEEEFIPTSRGEP